MLRLGVGRGGTATEVYYEGRVWPLFKMVQRYILKLSCVLVYILAINCARLRSKSNTRIKGKNATHHDSYINSRRAVKYSEGGGTIQSAECLYTTLNRSGTDAGLRRNGA